MTPGLITVAVLVILIIIIALRVVYELHHLRVSEYNLESEKIQKNSGFKFVLLSDLHLRSYGKDNAELVKIIRENKPDYILIAGDMTTASPEKKDDVLFLFLRAICNIAPVFYSPGNHEKHLAENEEIFGNRYKMLKAVCNECHIEYLENRSVKLKDNVTLYGLDLDFDKYKKRSKARLSKEEIKEKLNSLDETGYNIILAHNPLFFEGYVEYGADLVLSGHIHGGVVNLAHGKGLISPQVRMFEKYTWGLFEKAGTKMIVSSGVGTHKVNLRLFNRPEVVVVNINGTDGSSSLV